MLKDASLPARSITCRERITTIESNILSLLERYGTGHAEWACEPLVVAPDLQPSNCSARRPASPFGPLVDDAARILFYSALQRGKPDRHGRREGAFALRKNPELWQPIWFPRPIQR